MGQGSPRTECRTHDAFQPTRAPMNRYNLLPLGRDSLLGSGTDYIVRLVVQRISATGWHRYISPQSLVSLLSGRINSIPFEPHYDADWACLWPTLLTAELPIVRPRDSTCGLFSLKFLPTAYNDSSISRGVNLQTGGTSTVTATVSRSVFHMLLILFLGSLLRPIEGTS